MKKIEQLIHQELKQVFLGLGSNIGDSLAHIKNACVLIQKHVGYITQQSSLYQSAAWGKTDQADFINAAVAVETKLSPLQLLHAVLQIEEEMGRHREEKWGPRTIDIDILFYEDLIINYNELKIPHPHILDRKFVLLPLSDIKNNLIHPEFGKTVKSLLTECQDNTKIWQI